MHRLTTPLLTVLIVLMTVSVAPAGAQTGCGYPDVNAEGVIALMGSGQMNTRPLDLTGGAYTVTWQAFMGGAYGGNVILSLKRTDGQFANHSVSSVILGRDQPELHGETQLYTVKPGQYFLEAMAPGPWTVTIAPQQ